MSRILRRFQDTEGWMFKNIFQRLCELLTDHKFRKGWAYSDGISPKEYHYRCCICRWSFWNYKPYKGAPEQDADYNPQKLDDKIKEI